MITIRPFQLPTDSQAVLQLDTSFRTSRVYDVQATSLAFTLVEEALPTPVRKAFSLEGELDADRLWEVGFVAQDDERIVGFAAARTERWNRRTAIWHLYVVPEQRGVGLGRRLLEAIESYARENQSRCLWLETSNLNYPAIQFYLHMGFQLCGLDQTLYAPDSEAAGETALYFARPII
jgi:ribosomal protein S18 acetylase RimI-like enzyme